MTSKGAGRQGVANGGMWMSQHGTKKVGIRQRRAGEGEKGSQAVGNIGMLGKKKRTGRKWVGTGIRAWATDTPHLPLLPDPYTVRSE